VLTALAVAVLVGLGDGYLAYRIESPGTSLAGHCLLIALIAGVATNAGWWFWRKRNRRVAWFFAVTMGVVGVLALWWAWAFAMPAAMAWDSHATADARAALDGLPPDKSVCVEFRTGSIGPLNAPYTRCAIAGP